MVRAVLVPHTGEFKWEKSSGNLSSLGAGDGGTTVVKGVVESILSSMSGDALFESRTRNVFSVVVVVVVLTVVVVVVTVVVVVIIVVVVGAWVVIVVVLEVTTGL